jgi:hypothetical protein
MNLASLIFLFTHGGVTYHASHAHQQAELITGVPYSPAMIKFEKFFAHSF